MLNLYATVISNPSHFRQLRCNGTLITLYNCPLETKTEEAWSQHNYIVYVMEGRKIWHTPQGSYELKKGDCMFVRKGAWIVEQFFDADFCLIMFFLPDEFICEVLRGKKNPMCREDEPFEPVMSIEADHAVQMFFHSMIPYFERQREPDQLLLEIKFRELILTLADNPANVALHSFFCTLLHQPMALSLQRVMEDNFCFNLRLEDYARLCNRSLSAFKRDFQKQFQTTPGKWLLEKRLSHAIQLLNYPEKSISDVAYESGFENASHFSRAFRDHFGYAPRSARAALLI